jgi:hypothetical protein
MKKIILIIGLFGWMAAAIAQSQTINVGTLANDGTGDNLRSAFQKVNTNFGQVQDTFEVHLDTLQALRNNINHHTEQTDNPHTVTATQVGLGNVTNESKATMFTNPTLTGTPVVGDFKFNANVLQFNMGSLYDDLFTLTDNETDVTNMDINVQSTLRIPNISANEIYAGDIYTIPNKDYLGTYYSPLAGSTSIITLGTVATGTWNANTINVNKGGTGATTLTGLVLGNGTSAMTAITNNSSAWNKTAAVRSSVYSNTPSDINTALSATGYKRLIVDGTITMTTGWTLPANITVSFEDGGNIIGAYTLTGNNTTIDAGPQQIFNTNVTLAGTWKSKNEIYPIEWFGAVSDSTTNASTAINKTLVSFLRADLDGLYSIQDTICILRFYNVQMSPKTVIVWESGGKNLFNIHSQPFTINGNGASVLVNRAGNNADAFHIDFGTSSMQRIFNASNGTTYGRYGFYIGNMNLYGFNWLGAAFTTAVSPNGIMAKTDEDGLCYFALIENMKFHKFDTIVSIQNNGAEAYNGWRFMNVFFDTPCSKAIVLGNAANPSRATSHEFTGVTLQDSRANTVTVDIYSARNQINGVFFDDDSDSAVLLRSTTADNKINLTWSGDATGDGDYSITDHGTRNIIDRSIINQFMRFTYPSTGSKTGIPTTGGRVGWYSSTFTINWNTGAYLAFRENNTLIYRMYDDMFYPNTTASVSLGTSTKVWSAFYSKNINDNGASVTIDSLLVQSTTAGITASTTQTQGAATALLENINEIATVANASDAIKMPAAVAGLRIVIINNGANTVQIFPASGDNFSGSAANASVTLASGSNVEFVAYNATVWEQL